MITAKRIRPEFIEPPHCQAKLQFQAWKLKGQAWVESHPEVKPNQCRCYASYEFNGQQLCRKHASIVALDILIEEPKNE